MGYGRLEQTIRIAAMQGQLWRYGATGVLNAALGYGLILSCVYGLGTGVIIANCVGYGAGWILSTR